MLHHKANLNGYLSYHTGQTLEKINEDTDRDFFMSAEEAKDYGLIDGVVMNPHKILQPVAAAAGQWKSSQVRQLNFVTVAFPSKGFSFSISIRYIVQLES